MPRYYHDYGKGWEEVSEEHYECVLSSLEVMRDQGVPLTASLMKVDDDSDFDPTDGE